MPTPLSSPKGNAALRSYLNETAQAMRAGAAEHHATGSLGESITSEITEIARAGATGRILANEYWVNVGSGTPPGTFVEVEDLTEWVLIKRIRLTERGARRFAAYVSYKIEAEGSRDYRRKGVNVFLAAIDAGQGDIPAVIDAYLSDIDDAFTREFVGGKIAA